MQKLGGVFWCGEVKVWSCCCSHVWQVPGQQLLRHRTVLAYLNGETKNNALKEGAATNASIMVSTHQVLNTLGVKALLAWSVRWETKNTKFIALEGVHKEGTTAGMGLALLSVSRNLQESITYSTVRGILKCLFSLEGRLFYPVVSG